MEKPIVCMPCDGAGISTAEDTAGTPAPISSPTVDTSLSAVTILTQEQAATLTEALYATNGTVHGPISANNNCWLMVVEHTTYAEYTAYRQALLSQGFRTIVAEHEVLGKTNCPKSAMYANDQYVINTFRTTSGNKNAYVTVEPIGDVGAQGNYLDVFTPPKTVERVCDPMLIQIGVDENADPMAMDTGRSGMAYVIRLSDGRFVVYDGGFSDTKKPLRNADRIYNVMKKNAPDKGAYANQVVIAAWVITHPHGDHFGALRSFVKRYLEYEKSPVTLQRVIADIPSCANTADEAAILAHTAKIGAADMERTYTAYLRRIQNLGVDIYKAHTGQKYYFNDLSFEVLYTAQVSYPTMIGASDTNGVNSLSVVTRVVWDGEGCNYVAMMTGDMTRYVVTKINALYGTLLGNVDFVQIPHHGNVDPYGSTTEMEQLVSFYQTINADRYMLPTGVRHAQVVQGKVGIDDIVYEDEARLVNYAIRHSNNPLLKLPADRVYIAGSSITAFTLCSSAYQITEAITPGATYWSMEPTLDSTSPEQTESSAV